MEDEDGDFLFSLYQFLFMVYFFALCFRCMNQDYQWEFVLRKLWVSNKATSLPALFEEGGGQE